MKYYQELEEREKQILATQTENNWSIRDFVNEAKIDFSMHYIFCNMFFFFNFFHFSITYGKSQYYGAINFD